MIHYCKKTLGLGCMCFGAGVLLVVLLPKVGWIIAIGLLLIIIGSFCLFY